jgi:hypothetical protein
MAKDHEQKHILPVIAALVGVMAIIVVIGVFVVVISPPTSEPAPTAAQPTLIPSRQYQPEVLPLSTFTPNPERTFTVTPTDKPAPASTVTPTLSYVPPIGKPLPDLTIVSIGDLVCASSDLDTSPRSFIKLTVVVRNIGQASTHTFGPFGVGVYMLLGQSSYSLDEWANTYGGLIGSPNLTISNLDPNRDRTFTLAINLNGIRNFGIKVVANSGANPIHEMDRENNTLIKYFSSRCY